MRHTFLCVQHQGQHHVTKNDYSASRTGLITDIKTITGFKEATSATSCAKGSKAWQGLFWFSKKRPPG